ncbi:MAG TPA: hypothetical protein VFV47_07445 [Hyphomicrobiaceae bacterium]|nr:hypothetical protein [Hyphomicrobiaceae bacterium]
MSTYVVCGWYTPDYEHFARELRRNLDRLGEPHDLVQVRKINGGWERNTLEKPIQLQRALARHPGKTLILVDVDCCVCEPLRDLASKAQGDIAVYMMAARSQRATVRIQMRSGTMVVRPTPFAEAFVQNWVRISAGAPRGTIDQHTLPQAIAATPGLAVEQLDVRYCATEGDDVDAPVILHSRASRLHPKVSKLMRRLYAAWGGVTKGARADGFRRAAGLGQRTTF